MALRASLRTDSTISAETYPSSLTATLPMNAIKDRRAFAVIVPRSASTASAEVRPSTSRAIASCIRRSQALRYQGCPRPAKSALQSARDDRQESIKDCMPYLSCSDLDVVMKLSPDNPKPFYLL